MKRQSQRGFVLVTSLIFLMVLSLLSVMAMRGTLFGERMAANDRDIAMAREFAELALRDAERDILGLRFDGVTYCRAPNGSTNCAVVRPLNSRPTSATDSGNFWVAANPWIDDIGTDNGGRGGSTDARSCAGTIGAAVPTVAYGTFTGATFNGPAGTAAPRYIIEMFKADDLQITPVSNKLFFRITAVGFGRTQNQAGRTTSVTLQSVFSPL